MGVQGDKLLFRRESPSEPPNYFIRYIKGDKVGSEEVTLTTFAHPQPQLAQTTSELIKYTRSDGVTLTAKLLLPAG